MLTLAWPWWLLLAPLPWVLRRLLPDLPRRSEAALRAPVGLTLPGSQAMPSATRVAWRALLLLWLAWLLLLLAAARPQWLDEPTGMPVTGRDVMLAVDLSGSMDERDFRTPDGWTDRLSATKKIANEFIAGRTGDRIGLILFARDAYVQAPLTFDRATVQRLLDESFIGLAGRETAIGDAIGLAVRSLTDDSGPPSGDRVLVLLTDGVNNAGALEPLQAAAIAAHRGLRIYTIGIGSEGGAGGAAEGPAGLLPRRGADLDEPTLTAIAEQTGGQYFRARDAMEMSAIYERLNELEPVISDEEGYRPVRELYAWPLGAGLVLYLMLMLPRTGLPAPRWVGRHA